jgi:hypothetical protein
MKKDPTPSILGRKWDGYTTFSIVEAGCDILGLSRNGAYLAALRGDLPCVRVGRVRRVPRHVVEHILTDTSTGKGTFKDASSNGASAAA